MASVRKITDLNFTINSLSANLHEKADFPNTSPAGSGFLIL